MGATTFPNRNAGRFEPSTRTTGLTWPRNRSRENPGPESGLDFDAGSAGRSFYRSNETKCV
jgi:hypothetical protein